MRWLLTLKVRGNLRRRGAENLNTLNRLARTERKRLEQMERPRDARNVRDAAKGYLILSRSVWKVWDAVR